MLYSALHALRDCPFGAWDVKLKVMVSSTLAYLFCSSMRMYARTCPVWMMDQQVLSSALQCSPVLSSAPHVLSSSLQ